VSSPDWKTAAAGMSKSFREPAKFTWKKPYDDEEDDKPFWAKREEPGYTCLIMY